MINFWKGLSADNVYQNWDTSYYDALMRQKGFYNTTYFRSYIYDTLPKNAWIQRKISVGALDISKGKFRRFDE